MKTILTTTILLFSLVGFGQRKPDTSKLTGTLSMGTSWTGEKLKGSQVELNFTPAPNKVDIGELGYLNNNGKWVIKDTTELINALYHDIMIRDSLYGIELRRREWLYRERELAYKVFLAINSADANKVKMALHNYNQFIRTHQ